VQELLDLGLKTERLLGPYFAHVQLSSIRRLSRSSIGNTNRAGPARQ